MISWKVEQDKTLELRLVMNRVGDGYPTPEEAARVYRCALEEAVRDKQMQVEAAADEAQELLLQLDALMSHVDRFGDVESLLTHQPGIRLNYGVTPVTVVPIVTPRDDLRFARWDFPAGISERWDKPIRPEEPVTPADGTIASLGSAVVARGDSNQMAIEELYDLAEQFSAKVHLLPSCAAKTMVSSAVRVLHRTLSKLGEDLVCDVCKQNIDTTSDVKSLVFHYKQTRHSHCHEIKEMTSTEEDATS